MEISTHTVGVMDLLRWRFNEYKENISLLNTSLSLSLSFCRTVKGISSDSVEMLIQSYLFRSFVTLDMFLLGGSWLSVSWNTSRISSSLLSRVSAEKWKVFNCVKSFSESVCSVCPVAMAITVSSSQYEHLLKMKMLFSDEWSRWGQSCSLITLDSFKE